MLREKIKNRKKPRFDLMVDSGAWPAFSKGVTIDIKDYIAFLDKNSAGIAKAVNLDVIPKSFSASGAEEAAKASWKNYQILLKSGHNVMPVYHRGERLYWLEKILDSGCNYIGLGGVAGAAGSRKPWLDEVFTYLCSTNGWPPVSVHGFGVASVREMLRYPWFSVDTTSYYRLAFSGSIWVAPKSKKAQFTYNVAPVTFCVSDGSKNDIKKHIKNSGSSTIRHVRNFLGSLGGLTLNDVSDDPWHVGRLTTNIRYLQRFMLEYESVPFEPRNSLSLFTKNSCKLVGVPSGKLRIYFGLCHDVRVTNPGSVATSSERRMDVYQKESVTHRLACHYRIDPDLLFKYVMNDRIG
jgi:hypothetical protein